MEHGTCIRFARESTPQPKVLVMNIDKQASRAPSAVMLIEASVNEVSLARSMARATHSGRPSFLIVIYSVAPKSQNQNLS